MSLYDIGCYSLPMYFAVMLSLVRSQRVQRAPGDNRGICIAFNDDGRKLLVLYQLLRIFNRSVPANAIVWSGIIESLNFYINIKEINQK